MRGLILLSLLACLCGRTGLANAAVAAPPTPPTVSVCGYCSGPPPPPTPVPTAAPVSPAARASSGTLPAARKAYVNKVTLSPEDVHRGQSFKLSIRGPAGESVLLAVKYQNRAALAYRGKVSRSSTFVKTIQVPMWALPGAATVKITFGGHVSDAHDDVVSVAFKVLK